MIKAVIFDLDNTLYSYDRAHGKAFEALRARAWTFLGLSADRFDALHAEANRILSLRCGGSPAIHDRLLRYQVLLEQAGLPIAEAPEMAACYWNTLLDNMEAEPGVIPALRALRSMGLKIGVGTNMTADWQFAKLERLNLLPLINFLVTSEEVNAEKPDPRLFALCAEKAGAAPSECAFVGDSLQKDAQAAAAAGMRGIWYCPAAAERELPDGIRALTALPALPELLRKLSEEGGQGNEA